MFFQRCFSASLVLVAATAASKTALTPNLRSRQPEAIEGEASIAIVGDGHAVQISDSRRNATSFAAPSTTSPSRKHRRTQQVRTILILRIVNNGSGPIVDGNKLRQYVFNDPNSLKAQMMRCSANTIIFNPAPFGIGGVVDVPVQTSMSAGVVMAAAQAQAARSVGVPDLRNAANHVMFIMPNVNGYFAEAEVGSSYSYYNDEFGIALAVMMHEIGHNLGTSLS
jgi:hypothetical protein